MLFRSVAGKIIELQGAKSISKCFCKEGWFLWQGRCQQCGDGLDCPGMNRLTLKRDISQSPMRPVTSFAAFMKTIVLVVLPVLVLQAVTTRALLATIARTGCEILGMALVKRVAVVTMHFSSPFVSVSFCVNLFVHRAQEGDSRTVQFQLPDDGVQPSTAPGHCPDAFSDAAL